MLTNPWTGLGLDNSIMEVKNGRLSYLKLTWPMFASIRQLLGYVVTPGCYAMKPIIAHITYEEENIVLEKNDRIVRISQRDVHLSGSQEFGPMLQNAVGILMDTEKKDMAIYLWQEDDGVHTENGATFRDVGEALIYAVEKSGRELTATEKLEIIDGLSILERIKKDKEKEKGPMQNPIIIDKIKDAPIPVCTYPDKKKEDDCPLEVPIDCKNCKYERFLKGKVAPEKAAAPAAPAVHLEGLSSEIYEDHYEKGELESTSCGMPWTPIARTFDSTDEMLKWLNTNYDYENFEEVEPGRLETSKLVADHCKAQIGGWFNPTETEKKQWKKGKIKLYSENISVKYHKLPDENCGAPAPQEATKPEATKPEDMKKGRDWDEESSTWWLNNITTIGGGPGGMIHLNPEAYVETMREIEEYSQQQGRTEVIMEDLRIVMNLQTTTIKEEVSKGLTCVYYWDCECKEDYIHPKSRKVCDVCKATSDEQPDSRITELNKHQLVISMGTPQELNFDEYSEEDLEDFVTEIAMLLASPFSSVDLNARLYGFGMTAEGARELINRYWQEEGIFYGKDSNVLKLTRWDNPEEKQDKETIARMLLEKNTACKPINGTGPCINCKEITDLDEDDGRCPSCATLYGEQTEELTQATSRLPDSCFSCGHCDTESGKCGHPDPFPGVKKVINGEFCESWNKDDGTDNSPAEWNKLNGKEDSHPRCKDCKLLFEDAKNQGHHINCIIENGRCMDCQRVYAMSPPKEKPFQSKKRIKELKKLGITSYKLWLDYHNEKDSEDNKNLYNAWVASEKARASGGEPKNGLDAFQKD